MRNGRSREAVLRCLVSSTGGYGKENSFSRPILIRRHPHGPQASGQRLRRQRTLPYGPALRLPVDPSDLMVGELDIFPPRLVHGSEHRFREQGYGAIAVGVGAFPAIFLSPCRTIETGKELGIASLVVEQSDSISSPHLLPPAINGEPGGGRGPFRRHVSRMACSPGRPVHSTRCRVRAEHNKSLTMNSKSRSRTVKIRFNGLFISERKSVRRWFQSFRSLDTRRRPPARSADVWMILRTRSPRQATNGFGKAARLQRE